MLSSKSRLLAFCAASSFLAAAAITESNAATSATKLITLGTRSGPLPTVGRAQTSNVLIVNGALYVIDTGEGVTRRLTRAGMKIGDIGNIFITHDHDDHTSGLAPLMSVEYELNRNQPVNIYGPPGTKALVDGALQYLNVNSEIRISDGTRNIPIAKIFSGHDVGVGTIYKDANVTVKAVENTHFHFPKGTPGFGKYKSYSYRFDAPDRSIVFTGDTGPSDAVAELAKGADLLVSEVSYMSTDDAKALRVKNGTWDKMSTDEQLGFLRHMIEEHLTPAEVGKLAAKAGVKGVLLTHIANSGDPKDDYQRYAGEVKKYFSGSILVAMDLAQF
jgi:ribonuclease BN (tRNA processing enzyme)